MKCYYCEDNIQVNDEYYHLPELDINFHTDCAYTIEHNKMTFRIELRTKEE